MFAEMTQHRRRVSSAAKTTRNNVLTPVDNQFLEVYCPERKARMPGGGQKARGKENSRGKRSLQAEIFPKQAIKFKMATASKKQVKENVSQDIELHFPMSMSERKNKRKEHPVKQCMNITFQNESSFNRNLSKQQSQQSNRQSLLSKKQSQQSKLQSQLSKKKQKQPYLKKFREAVSKIFKGLDIFNRGTITETNINKWIPEQALYFLGKIFQKIRLQRLSLSGQQFYSECLPILYQSSQEDIKQFLEEVNGKYIHHNVSIDFSSGQKEAVSSPVQLRVPSADVREQFQKKKEEYQRGQYQPLIPFGDIIGNIKEQQRTLNVKLNSIKQKKNAAIYGNLQPNSYLTRRDTSNQKTANFPYSQKNQSNYREKQKIAKYAIAQQCSSNRALPKEKSLGKANFINQQQNIIKVSKFESDSKRVHNISERQMFEPSKIQPHNVPNFSFQLFKEAKNIKQSRQHQKQPLSSYNQNKIKQKQVNLQKLQFTIPAPPSFDSAPRTSRIVRQNITAKQFSSTSKKQTDKAQDTSRIDRLSSRLQQYIKFNKQKIQLSQKFIRENSAPKC